MSKYSSLYVEQDKVKVVVVGSSGVGKTSISNRFIYDEFQERAQPTLGASYLEKLYDFQGHKIRYQLWDTAGQEKYRAIAKIYYKDSKVALLVYDVTNKLSFVSLQSWADEVRETAPKDVILVVVGNKVDLLGEPTFESDQ